MGQKSDTEGHFVTDIYSQKCYMKYWEFEKIWFQIGWMNFFYINLIKNFDTSENYLHGRVTGNNVIFLDYRTLVGIWPKDSESVMTFDLEEVKWRPRNFDGTSRKMREWAHMEALCRKIKLFPVWAFTFDLEWPWWRSCDSGRVTVDAGYDVFVQLLHQWVESAHDPFL